MGHERGALRVGGGIGGENTWKEGASVRPTRGRGTRRGPDRLLDLERFCRSQKKLLHKIIRMWLAELKTSTSTMQASLGAATLIYPA